MRYLLDTNVWFQVLQRRARMAEVVAMLRTVPSEQLAVTDFAVKSIGIELEYQKQFAAFHEFLSDLTLYTRTSIVTLDTSDLLTVMATAERLGLDFDDAYQYVAAEKHDLAIVSFDKHFNGTPRGRTTPDAVLAALGRGGA